MTVIFVIQCCILFLVALYFLRTYLNKQPTSESTLKQLPGPFCIPFLGHVQLFFKRDQYKYLSELSETYGEIYKLQIGAKTVIVLNSLKVIKEAFNEWSFSGRPSLNSVEAFNGKGTRRFGFMTYGPEWKFLRRNSVKALSLFASSRNSRLQKVVEQGAESFHQDIMKHLNQPFNPKNSIGECIAGITGAINFGFQFDRKDRLLKEMVHASEVFGRFIQLGTILDYFPFGKILMHSKIKKFRKEIEPLVTVSRTAINSHKFNEELTDVADALHKRFRETTEEELKEARVNGDEILFISDALFGAGFATTHETLNWSLALMAANPDVQDNVARELKSKLQPGARPTVNDIGSTPYTEATLLEIFRISSLTPLNLPHSTVSDFQFRGYHIPANAVVISNLWNVHYDPEIFPKPYKFDPTRFLLHDGLLNVDLAQNIAPFSVGKRRCVGENLARQELYLLLADTVLKFSIRPVPGDFVNVHDAESGFIRRVKEHSFVFSLRH